MTLHKKVAVFVICVVALLGFVAGTRLDEINSGLSRITGTPRSSHTIDLSSVERTYQYLREHYDGELDEKQLVEGANQGLVGALGDDYTNYLTAKEAKELEADLSGEIGGGIGAEIGLRNKQPTVVRVLPDNPAARAGLQKNDQIVSVNDEDVRGKDVETVVAKIRGREGTTVELKVLREREEKTFAIKREIVSNPSVRSEVRGGIGVLTISRFDTETGTLARKHADGLLQRGVHGVILDLRGDGGGYMDGAIDVASLWLDDNQLIVEQRKKGKTISEERAKGKAILGNTKTVVLVDEGTASASEIVAGALRDHGKASLVGVKTFGKGSVQQLIDLTNGAQLKVTVAKWYTPKGHNINASGLTPDKTVQLSSKDINNDRDPQLDAALERLK